MTSKGRIYILGIILLALAAAFFFVWQFSHTPVTYVSEGVGSSGDAFEQGAGVVTGEGMAQEVLFRMPFGSTTIYVEIARTFDETARGLSGRPNLTPDRGMLFDFEREAYWSMWMKDMLIPLDMIWISETGNVVHIVEGISPNTYPEAFSSPSLARYVLEVASGTVAQSGVSVGDTLPLP